MQVKLKGIVLSETSYSETSKILNVLTDEYGLIGIISKGCKNLKNKLRGVSNKMCYGEYTINYKEKGLSTLIEGSTINSFKNIYVDMKKAIYAFYLMDLTSQVLKENNNKEIFNLLVPALIKINDGLSPELISNIVEIDLLDYVIIHELCHFYEPNHSSRFWDHVSEYYPKYKEARKRLRVPV